MQRSATRSPSSHIARLSAGSMRNPPSSASDDDSPVPKSTRPLETRSSIAMRSATRAGWLNGGGVCTMPWPRRMRLRALRRRRRGTPRARSSGCTPRGSGARPPTRSRCRAGRRARTARARPGSACTRSRRPTGAGAGARRRSRTSRPAERRAHACTAQALRPGLDLGELLGGEHRPQRRDRDLELVEVGSRVVSRCSSRPGRISTRTQRPLHVLGREADHLVAQAGDDRHQHDPRQRSSSAQAGPADERVHDDRDRPSP